MRIGFDLAFRLIGGTIPWVRALFANVRELRPSTEAVVFTSRANVELGLLPDCGDWPVVVNPILRSSASDRIRSWSDVAWQQLVLPRLARKHRVNVLFSVGNRCPLWCDTPRVQLVGNALTIWPGVRQFPMSALQRLHHEVDGRMIAAGAARADIVITESQFELDLLRDQYDVTPRGSLVLNNGRSNFFETIIDPETITRTLRRLELPSQFLLCVAHITCYSNHVRLIEAYAQLLGMRPDAPPLVLCGSFRHQWVKPDVRRAIQDHGLERHVRLLGEIGREDLQALFRACDLFVFPSLVEGFAYTLVEAMTCGAPIVCSSAPAMPETCANAAVYFDPTSVADIARVLHSTLGSAETRARLRRCGPERARTFPSERDVAATILRLCDEVTAARLPVARMAEAG